MKKRNKKGILTARYLSRFKVNNVIKNNKDRMEKGSKAKKEDFIYNFHV